MAVLSGACSSRSPHATTAEPGAAERPGIQALVDAGGPGVSEAEARELLDRLFREGGLRIVNDVPWTWAGIEVTLDGYDPERATGYEYIAAAEVGVEVDASERLALRDHPRIFLAGPAARDRLQQAAEAFLARSPDLASPDAAVSPAP